MVDGPSSGGRHRACCPHPKSEAGADRDRTAGVSQQRPGNGVGIDDRIPPVVEMDHLGKHAGAHSVAVAADAVDLQSHAAHQVALATALETEQRRCSWWRANSWSKTCSA